MNEKTTTIAVYVADRNWLQRRQMEVNFRRSQEKGDSLSGSEYATMPDLVHDLIGAVQLAEAGEGA